VWNAVLWSTGRRITMRDIRQVFIPGVFFGLNLALFFAGATHNNERAGAGVTPGATAGPRDRRVRAVLCVRSACPPGIAGG
jgi:hypothetical protein